MAVVALALEGEGPERPRAATLADYWAGDARWVLAAKWTGIEPSGAHMEMVGDRWYLFNRGHAAGACPDGELRAGVQVRESTDRGATWSPPVMAIAPTPGTPWSCAATDGDAVYDRATQTWRYLFQCKADGGGWNGCYAERRAPSPMGPFSAAQANPVIRSGELWGAICDPGDDCAQQPVREEGTFNVFAHDDRGYWISFHGSDGTRGYRGIARTADFRRFEVDRPDDELPADAILDSGDADGFREDWHGGRSIGAGAGTITVEDGRLYALNEFADINLRCTDGQNWDVGLFRSASPASTSWEPFPGGNPIVYSSLAPDANGKPRGCNVLYPSLFRDPVTGSWYLMHGRASADPAHNGIYVYRLVRETSLLVNGDFAAADARGWTTPPGTSVSRLPDAAPDGTPYLSVACDASPCASAYQDVPVDASLADRELAFGATVRTESGAGSIRLALQQLDAAGRVVHEDAVDVAATATYARREGSATVQDDARVLRFVLAPQGPQTFGVDNAFLTPDL